MQGRPKTLRARLDARTRASLPKPPDCPETRVTREERVHYLVDLIRSLTYETSICDALAPIWGVSRATVHTYAAEAARLARREVTTRTDAGAETSTILREAATRALSEGQYAAATAAAKALNDFSGVRSRVAIDAADEHASVFPGLSSSIVERRTQLLAMRARIDQMIGELNERTEGTERDED